MNTKKLKHVALFALSATVLASCGCGGGGDQSSQSSEESQASATSRSIDSGAAAEYMANLKKTSKANHLYYHYFRHGNKAKSYSDWDVWAWPYKPDAGEGTRIDWVGRTTSSDRMSASGEATIDDLGGAYIDIDLNATYKGGWDATNKKMLDLDVKFDKSEEIGLQIVKSETRTSSSGFWTNDGSNVYIRLDDYAMELEGGGKAYHVFVVQDQVYAPKATVGEEVVDPFKDDNGKNVTYGSKTYDDVKWTTAPGKSVTSKDFSKIGTGYQIMVSSFADSDGDGFGDIYGIVEKLDYLKDLGVRALWLTPIQLSDSYHGYDITDYQKVDPKFGSKNSPAGKEAGKVTSDTAMEDYKLLIAEAEKRGMKIVMDLVLNHTSTANNWYTSSANLDPDYRGYYQWGNNKKKTTDYPQGQGDKINEGKYWYPYGDHPYSYYAKFGSAMPELNFSYQKTRDAVSDMAAFWVKQGVGGFRLDAVKHIYMLDEATVENNDTVVIDSTTVGGKKVSYSSNLTKNLHFFQDLKYQVAKKAGVEKDGVFFVGENFDGHAYHVAPYYQAFDSMFDFYAYFNLTSGAATGLTGSTSGFGTVGGWLNNPGGAFTPGQVAKDEKGNISGDSTGSVWKSTGDSESANGKGSGSAFNLAKNGGWDFPHVYEVYNKYRSAGGGSVSLPGAFTSNHDIARTINRIAGTGKATGIEAQGNVTTSTYAKYDKSATLVKIAEILLPGCTWVYYGDEIGLTGNFPKGKTAQSDYADLYYRQPMKWKTADTNKKKSEGTTDYYVTGSKVKVEWDDVNNTSTVKGALDQQTTAGSTFKVLKEFIDYKQANPDLITGNIAYGNWVYGEAASNVLTFSRANDKYRVVINFNSNPVPVNNDGPFAGYTIQKAWNISGTAISAGQKLPAFSAALLKK
ncbi:MAG: hypothetical protein IJU64_03915 [Bacilli bacterium]|nr:hypothetical protein [Bacilli bacterium]